MLARSAAFDAAVTFGGRASARVDLQRVNISSGVVTLIRQDVPFVGIPVVEVDETAASRRSLKIVLADEDGTLGGDGVTDPLAPTGAELAVYSGFVYPDGTAERLPLGVFRITETEPDGLGSVLCSCVDRSVVVQEARHEVPYVIASGTNTVTAIQDLVLSKFPGLTFSSVATATTVPLTVYLEGDKNGDPWRNAQDLARADGLEVLFSPLGQPVIRRIVDPSVTAPEWNYDTTILTGPPTLGLDGKDSKNVAIVVGEGTGVPTPVRAVRQITDPANPLNVANGRRPVFFSSPLITTQAQADSTADALLLRNAGSAERRQFRAAPHQAHDAGDVVTVGGVPVVLSKFGMPVLPAQEVSYTTRARRAG